MRTLFYTLFALFVAFNTNAEKLSGRLNTIEYDFDQNWQDEYSYLLNNDNNDIHNIYFFDDDIYYANGIYYLNNPDRGYFMIPLYIDDVDKRLFAKHFKTYLEVATDYECESFDEFVNNPENTGPQWGFYKKDNRFYIYHFDI